MTTNDTVHNIFNIREGSNSEIEEQKDIKYLEDNIKLELRF